MLVRDKERCRTGHFFVLIAERDHVLLADVAAVYHPLYRQQALDDGEVDDEAPPPHEREAGCWAYARRYFFRALDSAQELALQGIDFIDRLFELEREWKSLPPERRLEQRKLHTAPVVEAFERWVDGLEGRPQLLPQSPLAKARSYAKNQRLALRRFLSVGILPMHNPPVSGKLPHPEVSTNSGEDQGAGGTMVGTVSPQSPVTRGKSEGTGRADRPP